MILHEMTHSASAPGSTMIFGEHAVLRGYPALVMAIEPRLRVVWRMRKDPYFSITTMGYTYTGLVNHYEALHALEYVKACLELVHLESGFDIEIQSQINTSMGFGSSAALVAALLSVMQRVGIWQAKTDLLVLGRRVIQTVQGFGSGADLAGSLYGGVIAYHQEKGVLASLSAPACEMELIYSGHKTPTRDVLKNLYEREGRGELDRTYIDRLGHVSEKAISSWASCNPTSLHELALEHQICMKALGLSDERLDDIERRVKGHVLAGKISGSGSGDCFLTWGIFPGELPYSRYRLEVAKQGVYCASE